MNRRMAADSCDILCRDSEKAEALRPGRLETEAA
jgi:hypothetical protein